jgi:hypothetical protein
MKHIFQLRPTTILLACALVPLLGCAGKRTAPAQPTPAAATTAAVPAAPPPQVKAEEPAPRHYKKFADLPPVVFPGEGWENLLDGQTLSAWRSIDFAGHGEIEVESGAIVLPMGDPFTGINYTNPFPKMNYEIALEALRVMGTDFFCGLTVPVGDSFCSLILGGWGGSLVGISSLNGMDASENETTKFVQFENGKWQAVRLRVTEKKLQVWIGDDKIVDVMIEGRKIGLRPGDIERCAPLGIAAWQTTAMVRNIKVRRLEESEIPRK